MEAGGTGFLCLFCLLLAEAAQWPKAGSGSMCPSSPFAASPLHYLQSLKTEKVPYPSGGCLLSYKTETGFNST